jgi:hypothetical protein
MKAALRGFERRGECGADFTFFEMLKNTRTISVSAHIFFVFEESRAERRAHNVPNHVTGTAK